MSQASRSRQNKGKRLEREVAKRLVAIGLDARRVPMSGALSWMKGDVCELGAHTKHVHECKNCERLLLKDWWRQAAAQARGQEHPVLHFSRNYHKTYSMLAVSLLDDMANSYEQLSAVLRLRLVELPPRTNFWRFIAGRDSPRAVYLVRVDGWDLAIVSFEFYLVLRQADMSAVQTLPSK
jgi:hypothetical protein